MSEQRFKQALILLGLVALVAIGSMFSSVGSSTGVPTCSSDFTQCLDNETMVNNFRGWSGAQFACKREATKRARYGTPEWPSLSYFGYFQPGTHYSTGIVTLIEPKAKFQNGFGAMARTRVTCLYDLHTKKVISVDII